MLKSESIKIELYDILEQEGVLRMEIHRLTEIKKQKLQQLEAARKEEIVGKQEARSST